MTNPFITEPTNIPPGPSESLPWPTMLMPRKFTVSVVQLVYCKHKQQQCLINTPILSVTEIISIPSVSDVIVDSVMVLHEVD